MSWRTVIISKRCKLDFKMGYMVVRGDETHRVFLDEMAVLVIENTAVSLTGCLLEALTEKKIRVIFCDGKRSPYGELQPYYCSYDCSRKVKAQFSWDGIKGIVWREIVSDKIKKQSEFLLEQNHTEESALLESYLTQIEEYDATNREGHAAKVYFNALFGKNFTRSSECVTNAALNYGYSIILSAVNREVTLNGYLTQVGLFHDNMFNHYNLSCDLMEPFRVLVDRIVVRENFSELSSGEKYILWNILNDTVLINRTRQTVLNAVKLYVRSVFEALNQRDVSLIKPYKIL